MYCSKCGGELEDGAKFCEICGESILLTNILGNQVKNSVEENRDGFHRWMEIRFSSRPAYHKRMCKALESEIDEKLPGKCIGNLFRYDSSSSFAEQVKKITNLPSWPSVNKSIGSGTANAALSHYKTYIQALETGTVGDLDINFERHSASSRSRRGNREQCEPVNCLNGLVDLIVGNTAVSDFEKCEALARYMVRNSYFFKKEKVDQRHNEILQMLESLEEKMPARFSTVKNPTLYYNSNNEPLVLTKSEAVSISKNEWMFYKIDDNYVPILIDSDGNRNVRSLMNSVAGRVISQGRNSDFKYATISHIWGNAFNPIFFTNLWNIVIVPTYLNPILDKSDELVDGWIDDQGDNSTDFYTKAVNFVNAYFKKLCYQIYGLEEKLSEYHRLGFDCSDLVTIDDSISINKDDVLADHLL